MSERSLRKVWSGLAVETGGMIAGLWQRRDLLLQFTHRNIEIRHRGSRLGALWALLNPLSMLGLYFVLFGIFFKQKFGFPGEKPYDVLLAMFLGLSIFHIVSETLAWAPLIILSNPNFVKKVVFPLEVLPASQIGAGLFHLSISLGLVLLLSIFGTMGLSWQALWLPVLLVPLLLASLGIAWALAAIGVFLRDIGQLTAFAGTLLLFASAVTYAPATMIGPNWTRVLKYNPLLQLVDLARRTVLWHEAMPWNKLLYVYGSAVIVFAAGAVLFSLLRKSFAEVI